MKKLYSILLLAISFSFATAQQNDKPNIVIMLVDNLGWGELGCYGGGNLRGAETPQLDKLASEGIRFQNFNVEPQCTPSRSALMTGRHPIRSGTTKVVWGILYGMTQWEVTLPELLSEQGYSTGMFGKWHLGDVKGRFPTDQGFDEWYGIANTTDESVYTSHYQYDSNLLKQPYIVEASKNQMPKNVKPYNVDTRRTIDSEITEKTINFITRNAKSNSPFFAFVPFTLPHLPTIPHPEFELERPPDHEIERFLSDERALKKCIPPLFKGYLRLGGLVCGQPALDSEFGTIDFFIMVDTTRIPDRYVRHFNYIRNIG